MNRINRILIIFLLLPFYSIMANPAIFKMVSAEYTGNRQLVYPPDGMGEGMEPNAPPGSHYIYEIKVEWYYRFSAPFEIWCPCGTTDLLRDNSVIAISIYHYSCNDGYDDQYDLYFREAYYRYFDWVSSGTYVYKARKGSVYTQYPATVSVTVP